jgi:nucleotide-binding universal stress UspA family protein
MINHILVPLDGSPLAECVLPHVVWFAKVLGSHITVVQALEQIKSFDHSTVVDPIDWYVRRSKTESYLLDIQKKLEKQGINVDCKIVEGQAAEQIIDYAQSHNVDLIALSSHGLSGISGWNVSSVVQKIILLSYKSILLIRASNTSPNNYNNLIYNRILIPLDGSSRAECALPLAINLTSMQKSQLLIAHVVIQPEMPRREPLSLEETELVNRIIQRNESYAKQYLSQLQARFSSDEHELQTRLLIGEHPTIILHNLIVEEKIDLMLLVAHGYTGNSNWPFGSVTTSFIAYGETPILIIQDLNRSGLDNSEPDGLLRINKSQ